jgi:pimeloyl-ACP methyl ester carboxylesterase
VDRIDIDGVGVAYELIGRAGDPAVALTPGGRFCMDVPGLRDLAENIAAGGRRVLIWDRPNCGYSDTVLRGASESEVQAEVLGGLIRKLDLGPTAICGGSGGARVSLLTAARNNDICSHVCVWWVSGDPIGLMQLGGFYCGEAATAASQGGMEKVLGTASWAEHIAKNPQARENLLAMDPRKFIAMMQQWASVYVPSDTSPVPGMTLRDWAQLTMPVLVFRSSETDLSHTRATSEWVHRLVPHSVIVDPPWRDDEWNYQSQRQMAGDVGVTIFTSWPTLAPQVLDFIASN